MYHHCQSLFIVKFKTLMRVFLVISHRKFTYSAAAVLDSLRGPACAVCSGRHVGVGWKKHHGFVACTSVARHPEELSPAQ